LSLVLALAGPVSAFPVYDVSGTWNVNVEYLSVNYAETLVLTQAGGNITGVSLNSIPPVFSSAFTITGGSVSGNAIVFHASYNPNNLETVTFTGTIANSGSMGGTWADDVGFLGRTGTWAATKAPDTVNVTGDIVAATVAMAYTGTPVINFGTFLEGRNPASGWPETADYGTVTITPNSDASPSWSVNAFSITDAYGHNYGKMVSSGLGRYLDDALYVSLDTGANFAQLPGGVTITGTSLSANFRLSAAQIISHADVVAGQSTYSITVQLTAGVTP
jgi:hypothetical protein